MNQNNRGFNLTDTDKNYKALFNTDAGQRVLEDMKLKYYYGQTLFSSGQTTEQLHFLMGAQSVVHDILFNLSKEQKRE